MRTLRILHPVRPADNGRENGNARIRHAGFILALMAIILEFAFSGNTLAAMGIDYASPGGNLLIKLHPGTYLVAAGASMVLAVAKPAGSGLARLFRDTPALAMSIVLVLFCAFYSIVNVGFSGAAVYIESYLSAGLLAVVLEGGTDRQKRGLAWLIVGFCLLSILISIGESITQTHLIPFQIADATQQEMALDSEDFRGAGLFSHPLTAALTTSMATFMLLRMRMNGLLKAVLFTAFLIGLLSFGGRAALGTTLLMVTAGTLTVLLRGIVRRDLSIGFVGTITAAVVILPPLMVMLVSSSDIGERILTHMYMDESADVRNLQWLVLGHLNLNDVLFGVPPDRLSVLKYQIGLGNETTDIENFWLLMLLNLGAIGFAVFLIALALFLIHLGRTTAHPLGWMLLFASILIDSTSNSLGRKSVDLFFMTACMIAMTGFDAAAPAMASRRRIPASPRRMTDRPGALASTANLAGFKT